MSFVPSADEAWQRLIACGPDDSPSTFKVSCDAEDLFETAWSPESSKFLTDLLLQFAQKESNSHSAHDFTKSLYQPTMSYEIRVLKLAPGEYQQSLIASLEHINIEFEYPIDHENRYKATTFGLSFSKRKKVPYTAISYCWGDGDLICPITVSGHSKMITNTLDEILRHLRDETKTVTLWVDQLCIDQTSNVDRTSQVQLMGRVYARARSTVVWLGSEPGKEAFKALRYLGQVAWYREEILDDELEILRNPPDEYQEGMKRLRALFRHPWFQRTWIIQEAVLSYDVHFMAGHDTISWHNFTEECTNIADLGIFDDEIDTYANRVNGIRSGVAIADKLRSVKSINDTRQEGDSESVWLVNTRYAGVKEPVDKVYGILGFFRNSDIVPDYTKPVEQLYCEIALRILRPAVVDQERVLKSPDKVWTMNHSITRHLCCIDHDTDPDIGTLPSWVPDWSKPRLTVSLGYSFACLSYYQPAASTGRPKVSIRETDMTLFFDAFAMAEITELSNTLVETQLVLDGLPTNNIALRQCIDFFNQPRQNDTSDVWGTFYATMVAGKDFSGLYKFPIEYIELLSFLSDLISARSPTFPNQTYTARQKKPIGRGGLTVEHFKKGKNGRLLKSFQIAFQNAILNRKLCYTNTGDVGLVPRFTCKGDTIFQFPGCAVPFVLRRVEGQRYVLVGECYALSLMDGSLKEMYQQDPIAIGIV